MMEKFDTNKIDQYLNGQLSTEEQQAISQQIANNPDFAKAVELHQLTIQGIEQFGLKAVKEEVGQLDKDLATEGFFLTDADIDDYLENKATAAQKKRIEKRLADDADFKAEFDLHQLTKKGIEKEGMEAEFGTLFQEMDKDLADEGFFQNLATKDAKSTTQATKANQTAKVIRFPFQRLAIAASVALAILAAWWLFQPTAANPQIIYANNFNLLADEISADLAETGFVREPYYDLLQAGIAAYNQSKIQTSSEPTVGHFNSEAIEQLTAYRNQAPPTDEFYPIATLYLAISYLSIQIPTTAIELLEPLAQQNFPQQIDAQWYLSLAYLKIGEIAKALPILKTLQSTKYQHQASDILKEIQ